jgi:hypothetical protein
MFIFTSPIFDPRVTSISVGELWLPPSSALRVAGLESCSTRIRKILTKLMLPSEGPAVAQRKVVDIEGGANDWFNDEASKEH